jgi:hypothetical protein
VKLLIYIGHFAVLYPTNKYNISYHYNRRELYRHKATAMHYITASYLMRQFQKFIHGVQHYISKFTERGDKHKKEDIGKICSKCKERIKE